MSKLLYAKLAASNLKKNRQNILPYLLSSIGTVMMFFIMASISANEGLNQMYGAQYITMVTEFGVGIIGLFSVVFLIYSNSFLMKRRKKEFGLFHILGMEKKHIALVLFFENLYLLVIALAAGIGLGVLLYRLMFLILVKLTGIEGTFGFQFYGSALGNTVILLAVIYLINFLLGLRQIQKSEPIELLKGSQVGEKEPKAKILSILTGVVTLGAGYYLAITCESSLEAFTTFFLAIVLVGVGTQCLFSSGSIALLKAMKRNKWYYYKLNHFTGVSGMLYRMKQNAAGLANICILSTGVLLVISITACLWTGVDNSVKNRYPSQISVNGNNLSDEQIESYVQLIQQSLSDQGLTPETFTDERAITATVLRHQNRFYAPDENTAVTELRNSEGIYILTADDYQIWTGESLSVKKGTAVVIPEKKDDTFAYETVEIGEKVWKAQAMTSDVLQKEEGGVIVTTYLIFSDQEEVQTVLEALGVTEYVGTSWSCDMDFHLSEEEQITVGHRIDEALAASQADSAGVWVEIREEQRPGMEALYGAVLFFGIFVGLLFLMGTVMIIYYKQVSEGYDDRERFQIMQKVGMSRREVKKCIHSQVLTVFFLPLVTAMIHTVVAFPFMTKIMRLLNFSNVHAFMIATGITIAVFAVVYVIVYAVTARTYYNIVEE